MAPKLTEAQRQGLTPVEQFIIWRRLYPALIIKIKKDHGLDDGQYDYHVGKLEEWLIRMEHSPKSKKKDWYRFLKNCLPNNKKVKSHGRYKTKTKGSRRKSPSKFERETGEYKI